MSLGSSIRSAAQATSSAYRRIPTRWRLAGGSAALTFVILCGFALIVGVLTTRQIRIQFDDQVRQTADLLSQRAHVKFDTSAPNQPPDCGRLGDLASADGAKVRVIYEQTGQIMCVYGGAHPLTPSFSLEHTFPNEQHGYRLEARRVGVDPVGTAIILYARPVSATDTTAGKVRFFLFFGVLGGSVLALLAGLAIARRAMAPIAELTATAREIERTRDPSMRMPQPEGDDEVAELARTLEGMLEALDRARSETEATLQRQREFVADASHELRTPLTSVLANLELLADHLEGEAGEAARSALRSSNRMRRLVANLLLLARADANRSVPHRPTDLADVLVEVAAELEPVTGEHVLSVSTHGPAVVSGAQDELHRLALNLVENALRHTPPGTHVNASSTREGEDVVLVVEDDGQGIPAALRERLFERFVRGQGDSGGGSGLGLSIVRAVAISHGGSVSVDDAPRGGARFTVRIPSAAPAPKDAAPTPASA
ncbi:MAG: integral rane sensor signal transduction histidine kinase [Conexibacter sp.]|nr:integral rane sensor signal transduction histidine kinase [Conexibacter sp.]